MMIYLAAFPPYCSQVLKFAGLCIAKVFSKLGPERHHFAQDSGQCGRSQVMPYQNEQRNLTTGRIQFYWNLGHYKMHFYIDQLVARVTKISCHLLRAAVRTRLLTWRLYPQRANITQFRHAIEVSFASALAVLGERRVAKDDVSVPEMARTRRYGRSAVWVHDGHLTLRVMTARLLRVYMTRMLRVTLESSPWEVLVRVDILLRDLLWSLYYSQILSGFWTCFRVHDTIQGESVATAFDLECPGEHLRDARMPSIEFMYVGMQGPEFLRYEHISYLLNPYKHVPRLLEIGVRKGDVPDHVLQERTDAFYMGVDPYVADGPNYKGEEDFQITQNRLAKFGSRAIIFRGVLQDVDENNVSKFHAAFVDGDHSFEAVYQDTKLAERLLVPGGVIMGHDFTPWYSGVMMAAVDAALRHGEPFTIFLSSDTFWWYLVPRI